MFSQHLSSKMLFEDYLKGKNFLIEDIELSIVDLLAWTKP